MRRHLVVAICGFILSACASHLPKGDSSLTREGESFKALEQLKGQLQDGTSIDLELMDKTEAELLARQSLLGLGDLYYLKGVYYYTVMRPGGTDIRNYSEAQSSFEKSSLYYQALREEWLQAQSTYLLALTNLRAANPTHTCDYYDQTIDILKKPKGTLREFHYDTQSFSAPEEYVTGVLGEACGIFRAQQSVAKNSR